jgi:hypothetical protein
MIASSVIHRAHKLTILPILRRKNAFIAVYMHYSLQKADYSAFFIEKAVQILSLSHVLAK